jgi:hypothetical protein
MNNTSKSLSTYIERSIKQADLSKSALCISADEAEYVAPINGIFISTELNIYGITEDAVLYYDESEGIDAHGGCWEFGYNHFSKEVMTCKAVAQQLKIDILYIIQPVTR